MEHLDEFEDLYAQDGAVEIGKHRFPVRHLGVVHLGVMAKAFGVASALLLDGADSEALLGDRGEDILPAISAATDLPLDALRKMRGDVQMRLFAAVLKVNEDFFVQCADARFGATAMLVAAMINGAGQQPSTTSAPADTQDAKRTPLAALNDSSKKRS